MYFVTNPALQNGELASMGVTIAVIISCILDLSMSAVGLWLIRPAVREKIEAVWQKKGDFADGGDGTDTGARHYQPKHSKRSAADLRMGNPPERPSLDNVGRVAPKRVNERALNLGDDPWVRCEMPIDPVIPAPVTSVAGAGIRLRNTGKADRA